MRKLLLLVLLLPVFSSAQKIDTTTSGLLVFDSLEWHFGSVIQGTVLEHDFHFTNKGKDPVILNNVTTSTNADVASYSSQPIRPGESGTIHYRFDTEGRMNVQDKVITITWNSENVLIIHIRGTIIPKQVKIEQIVKFDTTDFVFDTIAQGTIISHQYRFTNIGKEPITIMECHGSCHCIVPEYPKEPIAPGKTGIVKITFNSSGKMGMQDKAVTVNFTDCPEPVILHIKGVVKVKS